MLTIEKLDEQTGVEVLPDLVGLLQDAINNGASLGFLPPLSAATAEQYWRKIFAEVSEGSRLLLVSREAGVITGTVQAELAMKQNGRHRAEVQKLKVHTRFRNRGMARALLKTRFSKLVERCLCWTQSLAAPRRICIQLAATLE